MSYTLPRRGTPEFEREIAATPARWRWLLDAPGSPGVPMALAALASLGFGGLWPHMTGRQRAGTALTGWAFLGGFGSIAVWFAWFVMRIFLLVMALGLGVVWIAYAAAASTWTRHRRRGTAATP